MRVAVFTDHSAIVYFVISNLTQDPSAIGRVARRSRPHLCEPVMLYTKVGPPPIQGAINRGAEKPQALSVMRLDQTSLSSQCFIELYFSFNSAFQYV